MFVFIEIVKYININGYVFCGIIILVLEFCLEYYNICWYLGIVK